MTSNLACWNGGISSFIRNSPK